MLLYPLISNIIRVITDLLFGIYNIISGSFRWYYQTIKGVKTDKSNIFKVIAAPLIVFYLFTRIFAAYDILIKKDTAPYTEQQMTPSRERRVETLMCLQEHMLLIDRYRNTLMRIKEDDRPNLATFLYVMTVPRRYYKLGDVAWNRHCKALVDLEDTTALDEYLEKVTWLTQKEKDLAVTRIKKK